MSPERIDQHLDAVLKASGSALKYYSVVRVVEQMRTAMREAMAEAAADALADDRAMRGERT